MNNIEVTHKIYIYNQKCFTRKNFVSKHMWGGA